MTVSKASQKESASCDVLGLGTVLVDHQVVVPSYPEADTKVEVVAERRQVGGPVPTALAMLARLGRKCVFIGKWTNDEAGAFIEQDLSHEGIDIGPSIVTSGSTGFAHVWLDQQTGSRTVAAWRGVAPIPASELPTTIPSCKVLHLDGWSSEAAIFAADTVRSAGGQVFLDTGSPKPGIRKLLPFVNVVSCPERFLSQYEPLKPFSDDEAARYLLGLGPQLVIFTRGNHGSVAYTEEQKFVQPAFPIKAVDTTGAGDVFCGAIIHGILESWSTSRMLKFAAATAALKCSELGNREALPQLDAVRALIAE